MITGKIEARCTDLIGSIAMENGWEIIALETMPDHVHLFIKASPKVAPNGIIARIKGTTSRLLRKGFPELRSRLPTLWTRSYFVSTHGHFPPETKRKYVEDQKGI